VPAFRVKLGANDLNCVDVPLNPTHSLCAKNHIFGSFHVMGLTAISCSTVM